MYRHGFLDSRVSVFHAAGVSANARRTTAGARKPSRSIQPLLVIGLLEGAQGLLQVLDIP